MSPLKNIRRFARSRRGSMLIMVIVILVLLALIGTAMISTSRIDRIATAQHGSNVQIDMLLDSVKTMAIDAIVNDLFGSNPVNPNGPKIYRPPQGIPVDYRHWDSAVVDPTNLANLDFDNFLAQRVPVNSSGVYGWIKSTGPLISGTFESPYLDTYPRMVYPNGARAIGHVMLGTEAFPAFWMDGNNDGTLDSYVLAGDADGDGIADSGMFRIPVGELNGVAYYATVRIIDNNSAVNPTTAWFAEADFNFNATPTAVQNRGLFPTNLGLVELLADYNPAGNYQTRSLEMTEYNKWRFDTTAANPIAGTGTATDGGEAWGTSGQRTDFRFTTQMEELYFQLANRVESPGKGSTSRVFRALPASDLGALASRFVLKNPAASLSVLEQTTTGLPSSVYTHPGIRSSKYTADSVAAWYADNFNFGDAGAPVPTPRPPLRALLAIRNGVSNGTPAQDMDMISARYIGATSDRFPNYDRDTKVVPKTNINTAPFNYLWRGFWNVIADTAVTAPYPAGSDPKLRMFRNLLRDPQATPTQVMTSTETMMVRAALAAINAVDLRDNDYHVSSRRLKIVDSLTPADVKYDVMVYGGEPQPFITEVYANSDNASNFAGAGTNPKGYVAIELHNPYPFAISLKNYNIGVINRQPTGSTPPPTNPYPLMRMASLTGFAGFVPMGQTPTGGKFPPLQAPPIIAPGGYLLLENYPHGLASTNVANDAKGRPLEIADTPAENTALDAISYYVPDLHEVLGDTAVAGRGGEFVLLKPRRAVMNTGTNTLENDCLSKSTNQFNEFDEFVNLHDLVPVDQFDFTNFNLSTGALFEVMHYVRPSNANLPGPGNNWKMVYPGVYTAAVTAGTMRQEGVNKPAPFAIGANPWDPTNTVSPVPPNNPILFGAADGLSYVNNFPGIQWANRGMAGPYPSFTTTASPYNRYPYGGFQRNGDMLAVPFIGAYKIREANPDGSLQNAVDVILDMNSVTMDASLAEDDEASDNTWESIGRFIPIRSFNPTFPVASVDYYEWATDFFAHFAVDVPSDDYFPNVDPSESDAQIFAFTFQNGYYPPDNVAPTPLPTVAETPYRYPNVLRPELVANAGGTAGSTLNNVVSEELIAAQGLININTAPWYVLQTIPWVTNTTGTMVDLFGVDNAGVITNAPNGRSDNEDIARIVAAWRDGNGTLGFNTPHVFKSIYDLNKITMAIDPTKTFQNCFGVILPTTDLDDAEGDFSPHNLSTPAPVPLTDGMRDDWEEKMLMVTRVSNLITTRSDTFTVYVQVQGWTNIGTTTPQRVVQRRAAFIVDRTTVTPTNRKPTVIPVATP